MSSRLSEFGSLVARYLLGIFCFTHLLLGSPEQALSEGPTRRLVVVSDPFSRASLAAIDYDAANQLAASFRFVAEGEAIETRDLVRWGAPADATGPAALETTDGSLLVSDRAWSASGYLRVDHDSVSLHRKTGWHAVERSQALRATLDHAPDSSTNYPVSEDTVRLIHGDRLEGRVEELTRSKLTLRLDGSGDSIDAPLERVAELRFGGAALVEPLTCCLIGLADGSVLRAANIRTKEDQVTLTTHAGMSLDAALTDVVFVQPLGFAVRYLSDLEAIDYRHTPYFDVAWPYSRNAALDGGPLRAAGRRHAKGLATRSASRLVYRLDDASVRFQAEAAIVDQASDGIGSVVFRVYLVRGEQVEPVYTSPIVRGGDEPTPIDVETSGASALVLVVDYADDGDTGDEALWIDARLVTARASTSPR